MGRTRYFFYCFHEQLNRFKARPNLHHIKVNSEAPSVENFADQEIPGILRKITKESAHLSQQGFNVFDTVL